MTTHACHLDDLCGVRCLDCGDRIVCVGPDLAPRCPDHGPTCVDCAEPTTCTECLRVMLDKAADGAADHLRRGELFDHRREHDPDLADWSGIAEDRAERRWDTSDAALDRAAERYYGGRSA